MASRSSGFLPPHVRPLASGDPDQIGDHRLIGRLGGSAMGVVYAAVSPSGEPVALKVAHKEWVPAVVPARNAGTVHHGRFAVGAGTCGDLHGRPWSAVPYLPGPDLGRHVREGGPLPEAALAILAACTAEALATLHATGAAHGDVKPGNVILTPDGPLLVDHGIARRIDDGDSHSTSGSTGRPAPERHTGSQPDPASDVFSWACVVFLAATGSEPFGAATSPLEVARRAREGAVDLSAIPSDLRPVLSRALSADPSLRPPAEEIYLECLLAAGVEDSATRDTWSRRLHSLITSHWPRVDTGDHRPGEWAEAAQAIQVGGAPGRAPARAKGRRHVRGRRRKALIRRIPVLAVAGVVFLAAALGGGYLVLDVLAGESDTAQADSEPEVPEQRSEPTPTPESGAPTEEPEAEPLTGMELVAASLDTLLSAESFELTMVTHAGNGGGYGQPLPGDTATTPTLFDRVFYQAGPPEALRWTSTVSGARTSDLIRTDTELVRGENTAWNGLPAWYEAESEVLERAEVFARDRVVEPLVRVVENGTATDTEPVVFTAPPAPEDAYGHLGGEVPDEVSAVRVQGRFSASGTQEADTVFTLVATEDGVPLGFSTEGASGGGAVLNGRPVSEGVPVSFLAPTAPEPELWYTRYTFVELNGEPDLGVPDPGLVRPAEAAPEAGSRAD